MSTTHAILDVLTTSYDQINDNNFTGVILLDFQKAFDTVCHTSLLSKHEHYGIRGVVHKLLSSFVFGRQQYLAHQDMQSEIVTNRFGVPQGSNLDPLLFLIHINYISNALNTIPRLFADDTCLVIHASNPSILRDKINHELRSVLEWTSANKITVNPKKSSALILPPKITNPIPTLEILFNNNPVSVTKSVKYLGITIDEKLNFAEHITKLTCKISRSVGILSKLQNI